MRQSATVAIRVHTGFVAGEGQASARYLLKDPALVERSALAWLGSLLEGLFLGTASGNVAFDLSVVDRRSSNVVYQVRVHSDVELDAAQSSIRRDLTRLTIEEFQREYGVVKTPLGPRDATWPQRARRLGRLMMLLLGVGPRTKANRSPTDAQSERQ